ncbi:hypothetical protein MLD38_008457 [Melastoma candidum]|uniref:Uncharacterized protein n=1 Tax=Melastoma candidum TaxID=119954 RepID=A0ACB9RTU6_9MYRT|nr:hypothetical protein MLD38_008457 [Melastoma candidum]
MDTAKFEVTIQTTDTIKPSSPTPHHLSRHDLSFLDQLAPPIFMPLCLFYRKDDFPGGLDATHKVARLKDSLSESLSTFYPLAGRVRDNLYVDCGDQGVYFAEARVSCKLVDILENPSPTALTRLLPFQLYDPEDFAAALQVNLFACGGLSVCLCISHKVADALSYFTFLNSWAAVARGDAHGTVTPYFDVASLFPPVNLGGYQPSTGIVKEGLDTKRFMFGGPAIASLRDRYTDDSAAAGGNGYRRPTRVEALSAFLWWRYIQSVHGGGKGADTEGKVYTVLHAVNLRTRIDPPLPQSYFGNISRIAITMPKLDDETKIVSQVREAIRQIDTEYVKNLQQGEAHLSLMKERSMKFSKGEIVTFNFTSLCRFPMYEADFGWGKPTWAGSTAMPYKNLVVFLDRKDGEGIEAWVNLREEEMVVFEKDEELLKFTCPSFKA